MVDYKILIWSGLHHFVLIGEKSSKGVYEEVIPTPSQILSKLNIGSMYTFYTHNIKNPSELW